MPFAKGLNISPQFDRILNSKKVSDHHAIIPTAEFVKQGFDGLAESDRKLLSLICCKVLCAVAGPYVYEAVTATFTCAGKEFTAKGRTVFSPGWKEIDRRFRSSLKTASDEDAETVRELPELKEGQTFADVAASVTEYFTTLLFWKSWFRWALSRERVSSSFPPRTASIWPWYCRRL